MTDTPQPLSDADAARVARSWCKHFTGLMHSVCRMGVSYAEVADQSQKPTRWPCMGDLPRPTTCGLVEQPTLAELDAEDAAIAARLKDYTDSIAANVCPHCRTPVTRYDQVGRCVYMDPCGHRLWQGRLNDAMLKHNLRQAGFSIGGSAAEAVRVKAMHTAVVRFLRAGDRLGFTSRALTPGIMSLPDWSRVVGHFYYEPAGEALLTDRGGPVGTAWGHGWTLERALVRLGAGTLALPPGEVPEVQILVENTTLTDAKRKKSPSGAVVEGVAKGVDA